MSVGVVVIGRNEGERLRKCLESVKGIANRVVYVDSGSTDGSVALARGMGLTVVELDAGAPFTAARARNEGFSRLIQQAPALRYVQFVDGDCELADSWLPRARAFLDERDDVAAVSGRLRERYPQKTVYNLLCDIEWDAPPGESKLCGGIVMMRSRAFSAVGGFRTDLIAGEEPELCIRLRSAGWKIWRLDAEMALHDAAMARFGQWWRRALRAGYAYAEGAALHGSSPERYAVRESRRIWLWGLGIPAGVVAASLLASPWALLFLLVYPLQIVRLALSGERSPRQNWWRALFLVLGKFPETQGQLKYWWNRLGNRTATLIEHK